MFISIRLWLLGSLRRFYAQAIFPRLCDLALKSAAVARQRRELLARAGGEVLEIGLGTGLNLAHYPPAVRQITAIDPNAGMHRLARQRIRRSGIAVKLCLLRGEALPFADATFDCVVSTFTLCSIAGVEQALAEVFRVLKPGGRFLFLEHGLSPDPGVQKWQRRLNGLEQRLADGCHLDRDIRRLVAGVPFTVIEHAEFYLEQTPPTHGYLYRGTATK